MSDDELDVYTKKNDIRQDIVSVIGALKSTFCGNSVEIPSPSSVKERHHGEVRASKPTREWCFNRKFKAKKISGQQNNQRKPYFLRTIIYMGNYSY